MKNFESKIVHIQNVVQHSGGSLLVVGREVTFTVCSIAVLKLHTTIFCPHTEMQPYDSVMGHNLWRQNSDRQAH